MLDVLLVYFVLSCSSCDILELTVRAVSTFLEVSGSYFYLLDTKVHGGNVIGFPPSRFSKKGRPPPPAGRRPTEIDQTDSAPTIIRP